MTKNTSSSHRSLTNTMLRRPIGTLSRVWILAGLAATGLANPAEAQLRICNQSSETVSIAIAYAEAGQPDGHFISKGWYVAQPGECPTVVAGPLSNRYYYVRGEGGAGSTWAGGYPACTSSDKFNYAGGRNCLAAGFDTEDFFQIDTKDAISWTQNLTLGPTPSVTPDREIAAGLRVGWRQSALDDGSVVMQIHNSSPTAVVVSLRCFMVSGASKTLSIAVSGYGMSEVGFLQGWPGNFVAGERCDAYFGNELVWRVDVPGRA